MEIFIVSLCIVIIILSIWFLIRNYNVFVFQMYLIDQGHNICKKHLDSVELFDKKAQKEHEFLRNTWEEIVNISYEKMLFSFKPLKPEYWLNEKQLKFLAINKFD